ncbi:MAG TPA: gamma-glutamyl-gamma-aminobutyrate hydrolase family protein [Acidimicrobiia bacterium]|nr:gamma-glutamyl-gamma-aminobutyrate hydrolase family protein [Acidimicrobiia bacterium]
MRALIIEHDPLSTPERVGEHLESLGVELEPFVVVEDIDDPEVTVSFPDPVGWDLVVLMGAPWSAYDPRVAGWVGPEMEFARRLLDRGTPTLGICFGAQIMSASLGGTVSPSDRPEYGWGTIESDEPAIASGPWFQYHGDEFSLPAGAKMLASNASGLQAFSFGPSLAVQFHPEVTPSLLESWCAVGGDRKLIEAGIDPEALIEETSLMAPASQDALERMVDWWLGGFH